MIRPYLLSITALLFLAGCNPPASVVAPEPATPTDVPDIDDIVQQAPDGSVVTYNEPMTAPLEVIGYTRNCSQDRCLFNKIEIKHTFYNTETVSAHESAEVILQGKLTEGHGAIIKSGTVLTQLWLKGFSNRVLFEDNVTIKTLSLDGEGTGYTPENFNTNHFVANASLSDRCTPANEVTDLCTGYGDFDSSTQYFGNVEIQNIEITAYRNIIDLRYGSSNPDGTPPSTAVNSNPTARPITSEPGHISTIVINGTSDNELYLCGRTVGSLTAGPNTTLHVSQISDIGKVQDGSVTYVESTCSTNPVRP